MEHVAHQSIVMQFILELAKQLDIDPRACIGSFFSRIKLADKQYKDAFNDEYTAFKSRIQDRAKIKIEQALEEQQAVIFRFKSQFAIGVYECISAGGTTSPSRTGRT